VPEPETIVIPFCSLFALPTTKSVAPVAYAAMSPPIQTELFPASTNS